VHFSRIKLGRIKLGKVYLPLGWNGGDEFYPLGALL
jgi:hypothetical protein